MEIECGGNKLHSVEKLLWKIKMVSVCLSNRIYHIQYLRILKTLLLLKFPVKMYHPQRVHVPSSRATTNGDVTLTKFHYPQYKRHLITGVHGKRGPGSSVGIATDYGLDGLGIESRWGEIFRPSRLVLGSTQPPVQWVQGLSRG
jgi:hypothetical protein